MPHSRHKIVVFVPLAVLILASAACGPARIPSATVDDLMEDQVALDGALLKCNGPPAMLRADAQCANARIAVERLAAQKEAAEAAKHDADFERRREQLRLAQEARRLEREAAQKVDPYSLPVIPVGPVSPPPHAPAEAAAEGPTKIPPSEVDRAPMLGQTRQ